jgi:hypothetical protein
MGKGLWKLRSVGGNAIVGNSGKNSKKMTTGGGISR